MSRGLQAEKSAPERAAPDHERPESGQAAPSPSIEDQRLNTGGYRVSLPMFEGPLDLLLHLVQKHELDILNIPIAFITERYVEYIQLLDELNIDLASEYLVMAATLVHIKSRMLLPNAPEDESSDGTDEEELDPRAELVRRLLEYQKYKLAAEQLGVRAILGRDVFPRGSSDEIAGGEAPLEGIASFKLLDAFQAVLERTQKTREHQIDFERFSLSDKIGELSELLRRRRRLVFHEIFRERASRAELIITFLALLEMTRLRLTRLRQDGPFEPIFIELTVADDELPPEEEIAADAGATEHLTAQDELAATENLASEDLAAEAEPAVQDELAATEDLAAEADAVAQDELAAIEDLASEAEPAVQDELVAESEPVAQDELAVTEDLASEAEPAVQDELVAEAEPAAQDEPIAAAAVAEELTAPDEPAASEGVGAEEYIAAEPEVAAAVEDADGAVPEQAPAQVPGVEHSEKLPVVLEAAADGAPAPEPDASAAPNEPSIGDDSPLSHRAAEAAAPEVAAPEEPAPAAGETEARLAADPREYE